MRCHKKIVFFEKLDSAWASLLRKYLENDSTVYFLRIDGAYKKNDEITKYIKEKKIVDISTIIFDYASVYKKAAFYAHENVDYIFDKYYSRSRSINHMCDLLKFPDIEIIYKKTLLDYLDKLYQMELKINEIIKENDVSDEIYFYPALDTKIHLEKSSPIKKNIQIIDYNNIRITTKKLRFKIRKIIKLNVPLYYFFKKVKKITNKKKQKKFKVGINVDHPRKLFGMRYLTDTIFIDEKDLPKEHVVFIDHSLKGINSKDYETHGWNYTNIYIDRESISWKLFLHKIIRRFIPTWSKTFLLSFFEEPLIIDTNKTILLDYIIWNIFTDNYKIDNYLKRMLPDFASKTHILSQSNVKTWLVFPDNSSHDYFLDWDQTKKNQIEFTFMYYDYGVIYGEITKRFFEKHRNYIKNYIKNGVLFSQIIRELRTGKLDSPIFNIVKQKKLPRKIVGVFDTTYCDHGPLKTNEGIRFAQDILRLLDDFPDIGVVFKTMKWPGLIPELDPIYEKLKNHKRCLLFYMWDENGISASEVIAVSDFVISAAYTSTSAEALGTRIKAIYYDIPGHEIGDKYYYNRYPNFVAHNYEELKKLTNHWLNEITETEFEKFLHTYVKDEIDPYLDGKALTRLRKLLMK